MDETRETTMTPENTPTESEAIATSQVTVRKRPFWKKVRDAILPDEEVSFKHFFINTILLPWIRDGFWYGMDRIRYRDGGRPPIVHMNAQNQNYIPYNKKSEKPRVVNSGNYLWEYEELSFGDAGFANRVLEQMREQLIGYGTVSVADMYEFAGKSGSSSYTYRNYGWTSLTGARVVRLGMDWYLDLPKARPLQ